jgi:hypothetical protein
MNLAEIKEQIRNQLNTPYNVDFADIGEATFLIQGIVSLLLGIIAYGIAVIMTLITAIDIAYIVIPVVRERVQALRWDGSRSKHLRTVSRDAVSAVEEANTINTGKSALRIYLIKRIKTYVISVIILMLILGYMDYLKALIANIILTIVKAIIN